MMWKVSVTTLLLVALLLTSSCGTVGEAPKDDDDANQQPQQPAPAVESAGVRESGQSAPGEEQPPPPPPPSHAGGGEPPDQDIVVVVEYPAAARPPEEMMHVVQALAANPGATEALVHGAEQDIAERFAQVLREGGDLGAAAVFFHAARAELRKISDALQAKQAQQAPPPPPPQQQQLQQEPFAGGRWTLVGNSVAKLAPSPRFYTYYPCQPKTIVALTKNITASYASALVRRPNGRELPAITGEYSVAFDVFVLPRDPAQGPAQHRLLLLLSGSWGYMTNGASSALIVNDAVRSTDMQLVQPARYVPLEGRWAHMAFVVSESRLSLFVDGVLADTWAVNPNRDFRYMVVGASSLHADYQCNALYFNVQYANYALGAAEVAALRERSPAPPDLPFAEYPLMSPPEFEGRDALVKECQALMDPKEDAARNATAAVACLERMVQRGDPDAMFELGLLVWQGADVAQDVAKALVLFNASARSGHTEAMAYLGAFHAYGIGVAQNLERSLVWYSLAIAGGDEHLAYVALATKFQLGLDGVKRDVHVAANYFGEAADKIFEDIRGGDLRVTDYAPLSEGTDMQRDKANWEDDEVIEAERYHAEAGDAYAAAFMGDVHHNGLRNAPVDHELAARYYQAAANGGFDQAKVQLARMAVMGQTRLDNATVLRYINETEHTQPDALALKGHIKAHGLLGFPRDEAGAFELFKRATLMEGAGGQPFTSAGVMARSLRRNDSEARRYFVQGAARGDVPAFYWLGVLARGLDARGNSTTASDEEACRHFRSVIMQSVEASEVARAFDCYLSHRVGCTFAGYMLAAEMGYPEAAHDLAHLLRTHWGSDEPFAPVPRAGPLEDAPWGSAAPPPQSYLVFRYPDTVATPMGPWPDTARWTKHFQLRAYKVERDLGPRAGFAHACTQLHHHLALLDLAQLAVEAGNSIFADNATEAYQLFRVAAQRNHTEALYLMGWGHEHGIGGLERDLARARDLYVSLMVGNVTWAEMSVGALSMARMGLHHPSALVPRLPWFVHGPVLWYLLGMVLGLALWARVRA